MSCCSTSWSNKAAGCAALRVWVFCLRYFIKFKIYSWYNEHCCCLQNNANKQHHIIILMVQIFTSEIFRYGGHSLLGYICDWSTAQIYWRNIFFFLSSRPRSINQNNEFWEWRFTSSFFGAAVVTSHIRPLCIRAYTPWRTASGRLNQVPLCSYSQLHAGNTSRPAAFGVPV